MTFLIVVVVVCVVFVIEMVVVVTRTAVKILILWRFLLLSSSLLRLTRVLRPGCAAYSSGALRLKNKSAMVSIAYIRTL